MQKIIKGTEGKHSITSDGRVYSHCYNKYLRPCLSNGYPTVFIKRESDGKRVLKRVHRLVADAFIPNPQNLPCVNHKDGNKLNNNVENLERCSYSYNLKHSYDFLNRKRPVTKGELNGRARLKEDDIRSIRNLKKQGRTLKHIAEIYGMSPRTIWDITSNRLWQHVV